MSLLVLMSCLVLSFTASAEQLSVGNDVLDARFLDGECPGELDYVYYQPEAKKGVKYPLVIWLHGAKSGDKPRAQLEWYRFSNWASKEYQSRFENAGGAYLLAPRSSKDPAHNWYDAITGDLKATIDYFISLHVQLLRKSPSKHSAALPTAPRVYVTRPLPRLYGSQTVSRTLWIRSITSGVR